MISLGFCFVIQITECVYMRRGDVVHYAAYRRWQCYGVGRHLAHHQIGPSPRTEKTNSTETPRRGPQAARPTRYAECQQHLSHDNVRPHTARPTTHTLHTG